VGIVDDASARSECGFKSRLDVLMRDGHVNVHRMSQCLDFIDLLHPDRRSVAKRIDCIVVGHWGVTEHSAPEVDVNHFLLRRDRELHFLDGRSIRDCSTLPRNRRNSACKLNVFRFELPDVTAQTDCKAVVRKC
jgi:hypothetical protein